MNYPNDRSTGRRRFLELFIILILVSLISACSSGLTVRSDIDPGADFSRYRGATCLTPNRKEFEMAVGPCKDDHEIAEKALSLIIL